MTKIEQSIDVDAPVHAAYHQWARFEDFPRFMEGVRHVTRLDDRHLRWEARVAGRRREWDAEIVEHVPGRVISWRSADAPDHDGTVRFEPLGADATRVHLRVSCSPVGRARRIDDALGRVSARLQADLTRFKRLIENRREEPP